MNKVSNGKNNIVFNILLITIFLSPNSTLGYLLNYLALFSCIIIGDFYRNLQYNSSIKAIIFFSILLSFTLNINTEFNSKDILVVVNILTLLSLFPFFSDQEFSIKAYSIFIIATIILISQLSFEYNIPILSSFFASIYEQEDYERNFISYITEAERNGGLYYNPNQAAKYISLLIAITIMAVNGRMKYLLSIILMISLILTGSRTGLLVGFFIFIYQYMIINKKIILGVVFIIISIFIYYFNENDYRSLNLNETNSFDYKILALTNYLNKVTEDDNFLNLILGNFTGEFGKISQRYSLPKTLEFGFDAEIGIMISYLGIAFLICLSLFYFKQLINLQSKYIVVFIPFLIWPITSTILFSIKTSIVYLVVLGWCISKNSLHSKLFK